MGSISQAPSSRRCLLERFRAGTGVGPRLALHLGVGSLKMSCYRDASEFVLLALVILINHNLILSTMLSLLLLRLLSL